MASSGRQTMGGRGGDGFRVGRMVADGDLRLVGLSLLAEAPRHGYDVIKAIEELTSGTYSPSPGVIYPTMGSLEAAGHVTAVTEGTRKVYSISEAGRQHLAENRAAVDGILDHLDRIGRRIVEAREWYGRSGAASLQDRPDRDVPGVIPEINDARRALKSVIASMSGASSIEQHRVADILLRAVAEIRDLRSEDVDI
ncbi:PadR family transcriptional regulator [Kaistia terrae]|uniref:PadR family transcriptional regulator n=1 Tax=Kaistia terrae TaxID=537017 RepID=A0ABW0PS05_9HYPH|nr:PadR family transcriptional regulator [Kaistia terrae]MCX5578459.1 PadR family transcriptional regulator [Kaistia terrae]